MHYWTDGGFSQRLFREGNGNDRRLLILRLDQGPSGCNLRLIRGMAGFTAEEYPADAPERLVSVAHSAGESRARLSLGRNQPRSQPMTGWRRSPSLVLDIDPVHC